MHGISYALRHEFSSLEKPGRYVGSEYGSIRKEPDSRMLSIALCFPDLYEIGMSNLAIQYLYSMINRHEFIRCERVFMPAPDMENILRTRRFPLFTLENGLPLHDFDIIAFSIGYELSATNILAILQAGGLPIYSEQRNANDPLIIAGGPASTNPLPFGAFIDAFFIGEAECTLMNILESCAAAKRRGGGRSAFFEIFSRSDHVWYNGKKETTRRAVWGEFGRNISFLPSIVPNIETVQDTSVVEIMRGCPHGCRFCHAGFFYRPFREKDPRMIHEEISFLVHELGYREITLASLSSGDYSCIFELLRTLNEIYRHDSISFSFPSLKIDTFLLPLIRELSKVRKSNLTFAVESARTEWRTALNKTADIDKVVEILLAAGKHGWRSAKLYFMIGLPVPDSGDEAESIIYLAESIRKRTGISLTVNIGTFVPKPHTPFQWAHQIEEENAYEQIKKIRDGLKYKGVRVSYHSPFASQLEGIISRGGSEVSELIAAAFGMGARLDAWDEYLDRSIWKRAIESASSVDISAILGEKSASFPFPWRTISLGAGNDYLFSEYVKSISPETTDPCSDICTHNCGLCTKESAVYRTTGQPAKIELRTPPVPRSTNYAVLRYSRSGPARFYSHKNILTIFERTMQRAGCTPVFSKGFNPKPHMEFIHPLPLGMESRHEVCMVEIYERDEEILEKLNRKSPEGFQFDSCIYGKRENETKLKLSRYYEGSFYSVMPMSGMSALDSLRSFSGTAGEGVSFDFTKPDRCEIFLSGDEKNTSILKFLAAVFDNEGKKHLILTRYEVCREKIVMKPLPF